MEQQSKTVESGDILDIRQMDKKAKKINEEMRVLLEIQEDNLKYFESRAEHCEQGVNDAVVEGENDRLESRVDQLAERKAKKDEESAGI